MTRWCGPTTPNAPGSCSAATGAAVVSGFRPQYPLRHRQVRPAAHRRRPAGAGAGSSGAWRLHADQRAAKRLRDLARPPTLNDTYRTALPEGATLLDGQAVEEAVESGRFAIVNLWRNIAREPVATRPLALCDAASVRPEELVVFEIHYGDRVGENYFAKHDPRHRWVYWSAMTREEALLIKQWDSAGELARSEGSQGRCRGRGRALHLLLPQRLRGPRNPARRPRPLEHRSPLRRALRVTGADWDFQAY